MLIPRSLFRASILALGLGLVSAAGPAGAIESDKALAVFRAAKVICDRDGGVFWGQSLCGPILLIDPADRSVVANQADAAGALKAAGPVFVGVLPPTENVANTVLQWSGTRWTALIWPPPDDPAKLAHELFHRIQADLPIAKLKGGDNPHLDTLEGRYLLQLEWRALAQALTATTDTARRTAIADALLFRSQRYALFPSAAVDERALELSEGVAEYTGVRLGLTTPEARIAYALGDLKPYVPDATFVRSFAYATGPAYGLLLDQVDADWRGKLASGQGLDELLRAGLRLPASRPGALQARVAAYDDGALRASEVKRDAEKRARRAALQAKLVDGPILMLPLGRMKYQFNPQTLQPLGDFGTVYPTLRVVDDWGVIEVEQDALMARDRKTLAVSAAGIIPSYLTGPGWRLTLNPGWTVVTGNRPGDLAVRLEAGAAP